MLVGNVQGGSGTDNLVLMGIGTENIGKFLSFETLSMQGSAWTLTGTGTFSTSTTVDSGLLTVNGTLTSPTVTVNSDGTLGGTGTVIGNVLVNGTMAPGNSIGTLNITGNYTQAVGSTYNVEVIPAAADLISISGTATLQGGTVNVLTMPVMYMPGQRYTILTAAGGVTGTYSTVTDDAPFVDFALAYDLNNVYLDVFLSVVPFQEVAQTFNQRAAAGALWSLGMGNVLFDALLPLETSQAQNAFDLLSGEIHASVLTMLLEQSRFIRDAIGGRLRQFAGGPAGLLAPRIAATDFSGDSRAYDGARAGGRRAQSTTPWPRRRRASSRCGRRASETGARARATAMPERSTAPTRVSSAASTGRSAVSGASAPPPMSWRKGSTAAQSSASKLSAVLPAPDRGRSDYARAPPMNGTASTPSAVIAFEGLAYIALTRPVTGAPRKFSARPYAIRSATLCSNLAGLAYVECGSKISRKAAALPSSPAPRHVSIRPSRRSACASPRPYGISARSP